MNLITPKIESFFCIYDINLKDKVYPLQLNIILGEYLRPIKNKIYKGKFKKSYIKNLEYVFEKLFINESKVSPKTRKKKEKDFKPLMYVKPESLLISVEFNEKLNNSLKFSVKE